MIEVPQLTHSELISFSPDCTVVWCTPSGRGLVSKRLPYPIRPTLSSIEGIKTVIAVGGGQFLDRIKAWRVDTASRVKLVAVPSQWGSGSEASQIAITHGEFGEKVIAMGAEYAPDARALLPELADTMDQTRCLFAGGDVWSHTLEGAISPLADEDLRESFADLIADLLLTGLGRNPHWFELSARACSLQSRSSVGLVHGIAHQIEPYLKNTPASSTCNEQWGHAKICSTFLWPVMCFNRIANDKLPAFLSSHDIAADEVFETIEQLFDKGRYQDAMPAVEECWTRILRDPCSRTNSALVRKTSIDFFREAPFLTEQNE
jgi:alcohol dehydrogenase class IV